MKSRIFLFGIGMNTACHQFDQMNGSILGIRHFLHYGRGGEAIRQLIALNHNNKEDKASEESPLLRMLTIYTEAIVPILLLLKISCSFRFSVGRSSISTRNAFFVLL